MKKRTILLSMLAFAAFASCQKSDEERGQDPQGKSLTKITMKLGEHDFTKSVGAPTTSVPIAVGRWFLVEDFKDVTLQGITSVQFTGAGETYTANTEVNTTSTTIKLTGNYDGTTVGGVILDSTVNTRQGDVSQAVVLVTGEGAISGTTTKTAAVTVAPEMARIEILPTTKDGVIAPLTDIRSVRFKVFMINNTKVARNGDVIRTPSINFQDDYNPNGLKSKLYDLKSATKSQEQVSDYTRSSPPIKEPIFPPEAGIGWSIIDHSGNFVTDPLGISAIGYNIFPQVGGGATTLEAKENHPHIIIGIMYDEKKEGVWEDGKEGFLNIIALKNGANYVDNFVAGTVYTLTLESIIDLVTKIPTTTPITLVPDPDTEGVSISCTVAKWGITVVTPEV